VSQEEKEKDKSQESVQVSQGGKVMIGLGRSTAAKTFKQARFSLKLPLFLICALAALGFSATSASAETLAPWWHLTSTTVPSNVQPGQARNELQRLTVHASSGAYKLADEGVGPRLEHDGEVVELVVGETPAEVQAALEGTGYFGEPLYGAGNVRVTSPCTGTPTPACPESSNRYEVYEIEFVGELAYSHVYPMLAKEFVGEGEAPVVTQLAQGRPDGTIVVSATNLGDAATTGPITLADKLPAGLTVVGIEGSVDAGTGKHFRFGYSTSAVGCEAGTLTCTFTGVYPGFGYNRFYPSSVPPYFPVEMRIAVNVTGSVSGENAANVTGGGAPAASVTAPLTVSDAPLGFGVSSYELRPEEAGGALDARAGSHPFQLTATFAANENAEERPVGLVKDLHFKLPAGLIGNPTPFSQCTLQQFLTPKIGVTGNPVAGTECLPQTVVGVARGTVKLYVSGSFAVFPFVAEIFNLEPAVGEPARFGFKVDEAGVAGEVPVLLNTAVRTGGDYGVTVSTSNVSQVAEFISSEVTFWGVPGDQRHDGSRGFPCIHEDAECEPLHAGSHPPPLLSLPTACQTNSATGEPEPLHTLVEGDSWREPAAVQSSLNTVSMGALDGCNRLPFVPQIEVTPDGQEASKPTGLDVDVHVPQEGQLNPEGLAQSNIRNIAVTLPEGLTLNPSAADGLQACSEGLAGYEGSRESPTEPGVSSLAFTPYLPGSVDALAAGEQQRLEPGVDFCPDASKIAEVSIKSPLLPAGQPLKGFVYLASPQNFGTFPQENPFATHVAMYIIAEDPVSGAAVKLPGRVELGGAPGVEGLAQGQIRGTFEDTPQLAFEDAELHFFGGERAPLASPSRCGTYTTNATFTPWSGSPPVHSSAGFEITSGPNGSPCPGAALPFTPSSTGGATNVNAGAFSPFTTTLSRLPGEQNLSSAEVTLPPGLSGLLTGVELCREPQADQGTCGPNSQIGETTVSVGVGGDPFTVTGGKVFLTGPYNGTRECTVGETGCASFGLSVTNPAKAGPFDLQEGRPVVVRAKIEINPLTAALTVTSNPAGTPYAIPTIIEGFPLQIQHVNITTTRSAFQFNPTNCNKMAVEATLHSAEGGSDNLSIPFQVTNCQALKFTPKFGVSTSGKTSKSQGASLTATVSEPAGSLGTQSNITKVKVELPKALPSRLTTLQKACTDAQFTANPAGCPAASKIGYAVVHTPLIPVPLEGPAIFVSHGGEAFPSLTMVLQGYGITIDLVGTTFISKTGITSTTFKTVPDQPFSSFTLTLPEGPFSALAANGNLCAQKLTMPTEFIGQNGAEFRQSTAVSVTGCKPEIRVLSHKVKGKTATLVVSVPAAGKLTATGKGVSKGSGKSSKAQDVTVKVSLSKSELAFLAKHHRKHEKIKLKLAFSPKKGARLSTSVTVSVG
jgi:hypothetical protein